jgi:hypothetical protein
MSNNPFATAEAWDVSTGTILPARPEPYLCTIREMDGTGTSSGEHPQITVKAGNDEGEITDWIVVIPSTIGKMVQLAEAVGIPRPTDEQVRPDGTGFRLHPEYLAAFVGKQVGVVVRAERDNKDATKMRDRVKGYVTPDKAKGSAPSPDAGGPQGDPISWDFSGTGNTGTPQSAIDDDIPFMHDGFPSFEQRREYANR